MTYKAPHRGRRISVVIAGFAALVIVVAAATSDIYLGDEAHHFRFAQNIYQAGARVSFDPLYASGNPPGFFYNDPPFWHVLLALLWGATGGVSPFLAQLYHVAYLILLLGVTYALARQSLPEEDTWLPVLLVATIPMTVTFSTLLYMDVPVTAMGLLGLYCILRGHYLAAGIACGLMYLTKLNGAFFIPGYLIILCWRERERLPRAVKAVLAFVLPIAVIYLGDMLWRKAHINPGFDTINASQVIARAAKVRQEITINEYQSSHTSNPLDLIKYFGVSALAILGVHAARARTWGAREVLFAVPIASYLLPYALLFGIGSDIRYLLPLAPFLVLFCVPTLGRLNRKWQAAFALLCLIQLGATTFHVHGQRKISDEMKAGFAYVSNQVPRDALILYPEENLLMYGQRRMVWSAVCNPKSGRLNGLPGIFWPEDQSARETTLSVNGIDHILIKKSRVYDDATIRHLGGYPSSFVKELEKLPDWRKTFENGAMVLYRRPSTPR